MAQLHYEAYRAPQQAGTQYHSPGPQYGGQHGAPFDNQPAPGGPGQPPASRRLGSLVNLVGALVSLALVGGVGIWSYRLMVRDVSGVPVIRALAGPYRVTPDDPGGLQASYQGLAVNTVAAEGNAASAAQTIALAPAPARLSAEDQTLAALATPEAAPAITAPAPVTTPPATTPATTAAAPQPAAAPPLDLVPATLPGVTTSPVPRPRPGSRVMPVAQVAAAAAAAAPSATSGGTDPQAEAVLQELVTRLAPAQVTEIDPATLSPGTRLVQLGAYDSEAEAREAWAALSARFPALLDNRGRIVESATAGGRTFFRLRAHGFTDEPEARRFCAVFLADGADCIPVLIR